jgi:hypothetical protein
MTVDGGPQITLHSPECAVTTWLRAGLTATMPEPDCTCGRVPRQPRPRALTTDTEIAAAREVLAAVAEEFWSMFPSGLVKAGRRQRPHEPGQLGINSPIGPDDISVEMAVRYVRRVKQQLARRQEETP